MDFPFSESIRALEARVGDVEESQTRHRDLIGELRGAVVKADNRFDVFLARVDTAIKLGKWTLAAVVTIATLVGWDRIVRLVRP